MTDVTVRRIERLDLRFARRSWPFAEERKAEIDAHFVRLQQTRPLWNGRVLLMFDHAIDGDVLRGTCLETDFASFIAWRDWDFPDAAMRNCFAPAVLQGADGGYVMGLMQRHTANAGKVYFPCGTPDPNDVKDDRVDLECSARRELFEETGISADELEVDDGWHAVFAGPRIALMKLMRSRDSAEVLQQRIRAYIARETNPELADAVVARSAADLNDMMPDFTIAYLMERWNRLANDPGTG